MTTLGDIVQHPLTVLSGAVGAASYLFQIPFLDAFASTIWNSSGAILQFATYLQLAGLGGVLPGNTLQILIAVSAAIMAIKLGDGLWSRFTENTDD